MKDLITYAEPYLEMSELPKEKYIKAPIEITAEEYINSCGIFDNDQPSNEIEEKFTKQVKEKLKTENK